METSNDIKTRELVTITLNALTEEYGKEAAETAKEFIAVEALTKGKDFVDFLAKKIPVKSHVLEIIKKEATRDFLVSEFLSQYKKRETPKEPEPVFTAEELLEKIGYSFSEPTTSEELIEFTNFHKKWEFIYTMDDAKETLDGNYVFFLTHKNAANIPYAKDLDKNNITPEWEQYFKRNGVTETNGITPKREDPYGISVLAVQIDIETGTVLKIINRYNLSVTNPEFTFGGNLDKLTPGLEQAIYRKTAFEKPPARKQETELPENLLAHDGKFYFYTQEREGVYWGDGFVFNKGSMTVVDSSSERVVDGYILSLKERKSSHFPERYQEPYLEGIQKVEFPSKDTIEVVDKHGKKATLKTKGGCIISFHSDELTEVENNFLGYNRTIKSLSINNLLKAGYNFLYSNTALISLSLNNLSKAGYNFLHSNISLTSLTLNNLKTLGYGSLFDNTSITSLSLPNLSKADSDLLYFNKSIKRLFPKDFSNGICVSLEQMPSSAPAPIPAYSGPASTPIPKQKKTNPEK